MANPWLEHVKKCRAAHPGWSYTKALKECRKTYTPVDGSKSKKSKRSKKVRKSKKRRSRKNKGKK